MNTQICPQCNVFVNNLPRHIRRERCKRLREVRQDRMIGLIKKVRRTLT